MLRSGVSIRPTERMDEVDAGGDDFDDWDILSAGCYDAVVDALADAGGRRFSEAQIVAALRHVEYEPDAAVERLLRPLFGALVALPLARWLWLRDGSSVHVLAEEYAAVAAAAAVAAKRERKSRRA